MSEHLHPGVHPDADLLSAFVEGVLPEHERAQCLAHLAECSDCREIVFLTQEVPAAAPKVATISIPARRSFRPMAVIAAAVCFTFLGVWLYLRQRTGTPSPEMVARVIETLSSTPENPPSTAGNRREAAAPRAIRAPRLIEPKAAPATTPSSVPVPAPETASAAPPPTPVESTTRTDLGTAQVNTPPAPKPDIAVNQTQASAEEASSGVSGTVTDPTGAVIPQATVLLRKLPEGSTTNTHTDQSGQFKFTGLAPGQYELQISMTGFQTRSERLELKPQEVASVNSALQIGSSTETVVVSAEVSSLQTSSAAVSNQSRRKRASPPEPRPLPSRLPIEITVTRGKVMLSVDSSGALFFSGNSGKSWKAVKAKWTGKVVRLLAPPELPKTGKAKYQLTTESGSIWLSRDGRQWSAAPPEH